MDGMTVRFHDSLTPLLVPRDEVGPHPDNPKNGDVDAIMESMRRNGCYRPVYAQRSTGFVLAGNHTYAALMELGAESIPVLWLDVDVNQARRIMLADNRTADLGQYDMAQVLSVLRDLDGDVSGTGYNDDDVRAMVEALDAPFDPSALSDDDVDRLDKRKPVTCPSCGHEFVPDPRGGGE